MKAIHGKLSKYLEKDQFDQEMSFQWMKCTELKGEVERLITSAQNQALKTRYYSKHIIKQGSTDTCRMCLTQAATVEHIISGCQTLAADKNLNRHNQVLSNCIWIYASTMLSKWIHNTGTNTNQNK